MSSKQQQTRSRCALVGNNCGGGVARAGGTGGLSGGRGGGVRKGAGSGQGSYTMVLCECGGSSHSAREAFSSRADQEAETEATEQMWEPTTDMLWYVCCCSVPACRNLRRPSKQQRQQQLQTESCK